MIYWTKQDQQLIEDYVNSNSKDEKDMIYTKLFNTLETLIIKAASSFNYYYYVDDILLSDCRLFIYDELLDKITIDRVKAAQQFIFISVRNKIVDYMKHSKKKRIEYLNSLLDYDNDIITETLLIDDIKKEILIRLEDVIKRINKSKKKDILFFLLFKKYLLENNFDERGLMNSLCISLNIKETTFKKILYNNNVNVTLFTKNLKPLKGEGDYK